MQQVKPARLQSVRLPATHTIYNHVLGRGSLLGRHQLLCPTTRPAARLHSALALPHLEALLHLALAAPPPQCFTPECQTSKDAVFVASIAFPLLGFVAAAAVAFRRRPPPVEGSTFELPDTGSVFEVPEGAEPARDYRGELAFKAISYTPWPVDEQDAAEAEAVRIEVGTVGSKEARTYLFDKLLPQPSQLVVVRLPRPLGIVFEEDTRRNRAVVAEVAPGGNADQRRRRAALDPGLTTTAPAEGDVLRACTATNIVYPAGALMFGAQTPERAIVVFGADGQRWPKVAEALRRGLVADGEVTLVLERRLPRDNLQ